ncbi:MAG: cytochrome-c peroxidase [Rhodospirillales bacterium]|nr:cytochrome-c peroxidase [Rhodospirillales bacterium]
MRRLVLFISVLAVIAVAVVIVLLRPHVWSVAEREVLRSLWIGSLAPLEKDPSNKFGDDARAARLGHKLFFDKRLSGNGEIACSTCHQPEREFTDGLRLAEGMGPVPKHTPTIIGTAYSPWFFWDGRKDSQWSQALGPMESPVEHGGARTQYAKIIAADRFYRNAYEEIFGKLPDISDNQRFPAIAAPNDVSKSSAAWSAMRAADRQTISRIYSNIGKSIAAYERLILPGASRFDRYVEAVLKGDETTARQIFDGDEIEGLSLFIGEANCIQCHNGALFTNNDFHDTGLPPDGDAADTQGRAAGVKMARADEFNCLGPFSDAGADDCGEIKFAKIAGAELVGSFKTPTLRNVAKTAPYMHDGQLATLAEVIDFYNRAPPSKLGHSALAPLGLSARELKKLERFLMTLDGPIKAPKEFLSAPR